MAGTYLTSESLLPDRSFNWAFLVELLVCGILTVFILFYFNRLFATLVSYGVRAYTWHKYRAYIDAQALQISLLGGRVFFKGLRYHGQNQTVLVHSGYVTWRYWLRKVRTVDCDTNHPSTSPSESSAATDHGLPRRTPRASFGEKGGRAGSNPLPCRVEVTLKGLEWFIYNRSPAYDAVLRAVSKDGSGGNDATGSVSGGPSSNTRNNTGTDQGHGPAHKGSSASDEEYDTAFGAPRAGLYSDEKQDPSLSPTDKPGFVQPDLTGHASSAPSVTSNTIKSEANQSTFLSLLPVHVDCHVGAIVMGNEHTKCILVTKFERTKGEIDATSSGPLDSYKQLINFRFVHPVVQMKPNPDYKEPLLSGDMEIEKFGASDRAMNEKNQPEHNQRQNPRLWRGLRNVQPLFRKCVSSLSPERRRNTPAKQDIPVPSVTDNRRWLGLTRYLDEIQQEEREGWGSVEYAKFSTVADCPVVTMSLYWDVAGVVPQAGHRRMESIIESDPGINGDLPPEWGIDLSVRGGVIHYGPWTDRQRAELQAMFFPSLYRDAAPASRLPAGTARVSTLLKIFIEFDDQTILRIPTRESSKDWKWKGRAENSPAGPLRQKEKQKKSGKTKKGGKGVPGPDVRPFGWLDVKVMPDSTVKYLMDLVAGRSGYHNTLALDLRGTEMSSSVNHGLLLRSDRQEISCDLSNPLEWNSLRTWKFDIICNALELFLLRDHVFLLTDLVNDWGSGPSSDYYTFIPFQYLMQLRLPDFQLLLNANDSNIINSPADFDDNTYLNIWGGDLAANVMIPLDNFSPVQNEVSFELDAHYGGFKLHAPPWNTQHTFLDSINVASLVDLVITGRYNYYTTAFPNLTDTCILDVHGTTLSVQLYGFLIRYLMKIKDNYFGDDIHFRTFEEFRLITKQSRQLEKPDASSPPPRKANDMDVILTISASETSALLPANLYSCRHSVKLDITSLAADLRFTNYYMDLEVNFSPIAITEGTEEDCYDHSTTSTQVFVDGVTVYGHRLFGLPPVEPTYVCNWDFNIGDINGECTVEFVRTLGLALRAFSLSFDDDENALSVASANSIHDITFLRARLEPIMILLHVDEVVVLLQLNKISLDFNDWARAKYSERLRVVIPDIVLACVEQKSAARHRTHSQPLVMHAYFQTSIELTMIKRNLHLAGEREMQQDHIKQHDRRTKRTDFLINADYDGESSARITPKHINPPAMPYPPMPEPTSRQDTSSLNLNSDRSAETVSSIPARDNSRKSSFISLTSSARSQRRSIVRRKSVLSKPVSSDYKPDVYHFHSGQHFQSRDATTSQSAKPTPLNTGSLGPDPLSKNVATSEMAPSDVTFFSSYTSPPVPLNIDDLDLKDVPVLPPLVDLNQNINIDPVPFNDLLGYDQEEDAVQTSFIVNLDSGFRVHCNPEAVHCFARLTETIQPQEPLDLLDSYQLDVMKEVTDYEKQKAIMRTTFEVSLKLPHAQVRFVHSVQGAGLAQTNDQYDFELSRLVLTARCKTGTRSQEGAGSTKQVSTIHALLRSFAFSATERSGKPLHQHAAIQVNLEDLIFWAVSDQALLADLQFRGLKVTTASKEVEYLAPLIHRATVLRGHVDSAFSKVAAENQMRLRYLAFSLTMAGGDVADPLFLTRPSYILRSTDNHLRAHDSWKIISRFRYIYQCLPKTGKDSLSSQILDGACRCPLDAESCIISSLDPWRSWDLDYLKKSYAIQKIYGSLEGVEKLHQSNATPLTISLKTGETRLIIDPGPKQNELALEAVAVGVTIDAPQRGTNLASEEYPSAEMITLIQAHCKKAAIRLNWELCELVENIVKLYNEGAVGVDTESTTVRSTNTTISSARHHYHLIISTDSGIIALDTINLKYVSVSKGLKGSFVFTDRRRVEEGVLASLLLNADIASTELVSHSKVISILTFRLPSVYISYDGQTLEGSVVNFWNIALSNQDLSFQIIEDLVGLVEVVDLVLQDEVAYIKDLINHQHARVSSQPPRLLISDQQPVNRFNVAIFSSVYQVRIALLSTLTYVISGTVARSSVAARRGCELVFNFDLGGHSQQIESSSYSGLESIPELQLPPVNGRITLRHTEEVTVVELTVTVEIIVFDAAAFHGLIDILQQPEISNIVRDIRADSFVIKSRINKLFGSPPEPGDSNISHDPKPLIYGAHVTIAGLGVQASAPGTLPDGPTADLLFKLGCVQTTATNKSDQYAGILKYPDIHIRLRQVTIELSSSTRAATQPYGNVGFAAFVSCTSKQNASGDPIRAYLMKSDALDIQLFAETASLLIDVIVNLQNRLMGLDLSKEVRNLRRLRHGKPHTDLSDTDASESNAGNLALDHGSSILFNSIYSFEILNVQVCWIVGSSAPASPGRLCEDLVLSLRKIHLATKKENAARLMIEDLQLQMVPTSESKHERSLNSALLPEVVFNVANLSTKEDRRFAFQAAGKSLDLRLTSQFVLPARDLQSSIATASEKLRFASANWMATSTKTGGERKSLLSNKRLASLLVDADFAGASVYIQGRKVIDRRRSTFSMLQGGRSPQHGRYGQFTTEDASSSTTLRSPGVAFKIEYKDDGLLDPALNAEIKVDASTNVLYPTVVPLVLEISSSVREIVQEPKQDQLTPKSKTPSQLLQDENLLTADPSAILGRTKLNLGLRICKQEFSLSCKPIARVTAIARLEDIYITANTVRSMEHGHFFAISAAFTRLQASVQHVYSRESTGNLEVESLVLSLMNSRHLNGTSGISAILKISPTKLQINAKQLQDFLLFREIWVPPEIRQARPAPAHEGPLEPQAYFAQRYQQVAAAGAFPWNATIAVAELDIEVDLGQALGKSTLKIVDFWVSSKKTSDWEQNLCLGFDRIIINSTGRMSGFVDLQRFKVRTSIQWPAREKALNQTPLIQASLGFSELRTKAAFDYQAFLITDITSFEFLMYNVRDASKEKGDRLVAILDGDKVQVFSTTQSASQGLALYQAYVRLIEERRTAYETSLRDIEKFLRRKSTLNPMSTQLPVGSPSVKDDHAVKTPISLHTDVVVTLKAITIGAFPGTFFDNQIFKLEALAAQARFAVIVEEGKIHSGLGLTLGQFRIALAAVKRPNVPKTLGEVAVSDVVGSAVDAGGGTILRVPKLVATMQTWQSPQSNHIDFIFKSSFEGKVDVGWNYSRISFIRGMWTSHARALAHRLGKPLPQQSAVKITGGPQPEQDGKQRQPYTGEQEKITAVVNVPQSKYKYAALEPPIIETPQLRDMGEATPPLEWIGLNRERLPNLTHQIAIVALLEVAKEVEDAYFRILGSS